MEFLIVFITIWLWLLANFVEKSRKREKEHYTFDEKGFNNLWLHQNGTYFDNEWYDKYGFDKFGNKRKDM